MWKSESQYQEHIDPHWLMLGGALVCLLSAGVLVHFGSALREWPSARAEIISVDVKCRLTTSERRSRQSGYRSISILMPCDRVADFVSDNSDRVWSTTKVYSGQVRVAGDGAVTLVETDLSQSFVGGTPERGKIFDVVQDPENPQNIRSSTANFVLTALGFGVGAIGVVIGVLAFLWF